MEKHNIFHYRTIDSTNLQLSKMAEDGAPEMTVVVADAQTAGRGRRGRSWESPAGENIYLSLLLRPPFTTEQAPMITLVMAYCVAKALQKFHFLEAQIKWPNDVILNGKKVCGILTEMKLNGADIEHIIVGVGVNVSTKHFPEHLVDKATSLYLESKEEVNKNELIQAILDEFEILYRQFSLAQDLSFICEEYNAMLVNREQDVCVLDAKGEFIARAKGINKRGELLVVTKEGEQVAIFAGEVSVRGVYGYV